MLHERLGGEEDITLELELRALQRARDEQEREVAVDGPEMADQLGTGHHGKFEIDDGGIEAERICAELTKGR